MHYANQTDILTIQPFRHIELACLLARSLSSVNHEATIIRMNTKKAIPFPTSLQCPKIRHELPYFTVIVVMHPVR